jgi:hypothetical protein
MNNEIATQDNSFDISDFMTDSVKEIEGVWFPLGKGREIKLAFHRNDSATALIRAKYRANRVVLEQDDDISSKMNEDLMIEVYAETVIKGLRVNGNEVPYNRQVGLDLLKHRIFRDKVYAYAQNAEGYRVKAEEAAVKS